MSTELASWVKAHAVPLKSVDPSDDNHNDLAPILEMVGDARIVALGESTHGTLEEAQIKHRLFRYLTGHGFRAFLLERDMAVVAEIDDDIRAGRPIETLPIGFHPWRSVEMLELLRWMQDQCRSGRQLRAFGFDMQQETGPSSVDIVRAYLSERAPGAASLVDLDILGRSLDLESEGMLDSGVVEAARRVRAAVPPGDDWDAKWAARHALIVEQAVSYREAEPETEEEEKEAMFLRDRYMAEHIEWIVDNLPPEDRVVVWAHNFHVGRIERYMGAVLADRFGADYVPVGLGFHRGRFRARTYESEGGPFSAPVEVDALVPDASCIEDAFHGAGPDHFFVDLRSLPASPADALTRVVGWNIKVPREVPDEFEPVRLHEAFDGFVFFEETNPLDILDWPFG